MASSRPNRWPILFDTSHLDTPTDGSYVQSFDCETITPHVEVPVPCGMTQRLAMPRSGRRLTDYFLNEDDFGKIHFEGDHKVHVINVTEDTLTEDTSFHVDFNTAFPTPARPHGIAMK